MAYSKSINWVGRNVDRFSCGNYGRAQRAIANQFDEFDNVMRPENKHLWEEAEKRKAEERQKRLDSYDE